MIVFDIETGPLPDEQLLPLLPAFEETAFDSEAVKLGQLKDEDKIKEKIESARVKHEANQKAAKEKHEADFRGKAALNAMTGRVLAIGYKTEKGVRIDHAGEIDEPALLTAFWELYGRCRTSKRAVVGFNSHGFDLPFLIHRSWYHGVAVPSTVMEGRYWDRIFVDLMQKWTCGAYGKYVGLGQVSQFLGIGGKPDGTTGADFARLFFESDESRVQAIKYLENDLIMTFGLALKMGVG